MREGPLIWLVLGAIAIGAVLLLFSGDTGQVLGIEDEIFAHTLYLGTLGAVIAAGILGSGLRFGQTVRSAVIWLGIILLLVAGYQYRYEFQDVANRISAGLVPGSPLSRTDADGRVSVMLERMGNGHFEVRALVNDASIWVMIDTGATSTVLTSDDARRAGLASEDLSYTVPVTTANGRAHAARAVVEEIRIGDIVRTRVPVLVAASGRLDQSLLGMNFIGTLSGFDMRGERLILRD